LEFTAGILLETPAKVGAELSWIQETLESSKIEVVAVLPDRDFVFSVAFSIETFLP